jgi:hypothetical protein
MYATVFAIDYTWLMDFWWYAAKRDGVFYAATSQVGKHCKDTKIIFMHKMISKQYGMKVCDHQNHDGTDNRRSNLRPATGSQNIANGRRRSNNTSGYIGVSLFRQTGQWSSYLTVNYKRIHLGYFDQPEKAARVRDLEAKRYFGKFAMLNFPNG